MNRNIVKIISVSLTVLLCITATAQNLDPTVEVNRSYEGKLLEVYKPSLKMTVPDTVRRFDLDFDYSVFDNPYKGSYEFKPYELLMKPFSVDRKMPSFWLKAGAGYTLHPDLELVWSPVRDGNFTMSVYGDVDGYFGTFRSFKPGDINKLPLDMDRWKTDSGMTSLWKGRWLKSNVGIQGQYDWKKAAFSFDMGYFGITSKDTLKTRGFNGMELKFNVASKPSGDVYFHYDIDLDYSLGFDRVHFEAIRDADLNEHNFNFDAEVGAVIAKSHHLLFDMGLQTVAYSGVFGVSASEISITPHYLMNKGRWHLDLGLKLAKVIVPEESVYFNERDQILYPDVSVRFAAKKDVLSLYANAGGGNILNTYRSIVHSNPFADVDFGRGKPMLDNSVERLSVVAGLDGRISKRFMYDLHAGYSNIKNGLSDAVVLTEPSQGTYHYLPAIGYASYQKFFVGLDWNWYAESLVFEGGVEYAGFTGLDEYSYIILPAQFTGDISLEYNWKRRIFIGADCRFASARKGSSALYDPESGLATMVAKTIMPGFADLGVSAEFALSNRFSVWVRGGNLMNMTVQYYPLYAEKGINFTAGICLKL